MKYQTDQQGAFDFIYLTCIVHYIIIFILHNHPPLCLVRRLKSRQQERKVGSFFLESYLVTETNKALHFCLFIAQSFHMSHIYGDVYLSFNLTR